jgi:hypothetical protein
MGGTRGGVRGGGFRVLEALAGVPGQGRLRVRMWNLRELRPPENRRRAEALIRFRPGLPSRWFKGLIPNEKRT